MAAARDLRRFTEFGRKIIGVGRNFRFGSEHLDLVFQLVLSLTIFIHGVLSREHAAELGNPVPKTPLIFLKPPSSYLQQGGKIKVNLISKISFIVKIKMCVV